MAVEVIKQTYKPMMTVGQVYAKAWGTDGAPKEVGNVLELNLEHSEDVQTQDDMTKLGGGVHAEVRRVKDVKVKMKLADLNVINIARGVLASIAPVEAGDVVDMPYAVSQLGVLIPLEHIGPTDVVIKKGADAASAQQWPWRATTSHAAKALCCCLVLWVLLRPTSCGSATRMAPMR